MPRELPPPPVPGLQKAGSELPERRKEAEKKIEFSPEQTQFIVDLLLKVCLETEIGRPKSPLRRAEHWARQSLVAARMYRADPRVSELIDKARGCIHEVAAVQTVANRFVWERVANGMEITEEVEKQLNEIRVEEDF